MMPAFLIFTEASLPQRMDGSMVPAFWFDLRRRIFAVGFDQVATKAAGLN
jgi:hypothetical protein